MASKCTTCDHKNQSKSCHCEPTVVLMVAMPDYKMVDGVWLRGAPAASELQAKRPDAAQAAGDAQAL